MDEITRRSFGGLASGALAAGLGFGLSRSSALESAGITWVSDDPHLSGNFAPVGPELDVADLPVIAGRIPPDLSGAYMRNGPNPLFKPISYTYPVDGDGMIHAIYLDSGRARYRNRFVRTGSLAVERRAGRAVYGAWCIRFRSIRRLSGRAKIPGRSRTAPSSTCCVTAIICWRWVKPRTPTK
jgi:carotenoid cleavage dioxygenase